MAVTITLTLNIKEEAVDAFCAGFPEMLKDTSRFPGFQAIRVLRHNSDPSRVILIEDWDSEEAYNAYIAWRTERGDMAAMAGVLAGPPSAEIWSTRVASADSQTGVHP